jgi:two-component system NtrC family sensor kinase
MQELILESGAPEAERVASWQAPSPSPQGGRRHCQLTVNGEPVWQLCVSGSAGRPSDERIHRAGTALEAWREAQLELDRAETRLAARTQELSLIQSLGRMAAEAQTPSELFLATINTLQQGEELDLALVGHELDGSPELSAFLSRPFAGPCLQKIAARAGLLLGWAPDALPEPNQLHLDTFDEARGRRGEFLEEELVVLPILRQESNVACVMVLPARRPAEGGLRLLFSAANQLSLHLDRILSVREAEADRFRSILDSMPQAVVLADRHLRVVQHNRSAGTMFETLGLPLGGSLEETLERLNLLGLVDQVRLARAPLADGEVRTDGDRVLSVTVSPSRGPAGDTGLVIVLTDVTEHRRMQEHLAHSDKMSSLGQMISGVTHELNNPLTSILGYAQLLGATSPDERTAERAKVLQREAQRCQKIVANLLSFARKRAPERKPLSLNEVAQSVLSLMGYQLRVDGIQVRTELSPLIPALRGDPHELQQVLVNLLTNAQQAIREAGEGGEIILRTLPTEHDSVVLEIEDSGPGIPESIRTKIFDPFFTTKAEGKGTGLGLALVYGIVESHGGTIEIPPVPGGGARFRINFPTTPRDESGVTGVPGDPVPLPVRAGRVLIVDDEEPLARLICDALSEDGHEAVFVGDGREALTLLAEEEFDLVISDIKMPGMGGERLVKEIERDHPDVLRRLLLITGDTMGADSEQLISRTRLEVLRKPFDLADLRQRVQSRLTADRR